MLPSRSPLNPDGSIIIMGLFSEYHYCPVKQFRKSCNRMITGKKLTKMSFYDLKSFPGFSGLVPLSISLEEGCREPRTNHIRSNHAVSFSRRVQPVCSALQWKPIHQALFLL